jgi:ferredoxin
VLDSTKTLKILGQDTIILFKSNQNLLDILNDNKVSIDQSCGANGTCTTCRVITHSPAKNFSPRTDVENERAKERDFADNERLACQTNLIESVIIEIPEPSN